MGNSKFTKRLVIGLIVALALATAVGIVVVVVAARTALIAEENYQAYLHAQQAVLKYVEETGGQWPKSWEDLKATSPETDFSWVIPRVQIDFNANTKAIAKQSPGMFKAIEPTQPCYVIDHKVQFLIDKLRDIQAVD